MKKINKMENTTEIKRTRGRPQRFSVFKIDTKTGIVLHNKIPVDPAIAYKVFTELISGSMKKEEVKEVRTE